MHVRSIAVATAVAGAMLAARIPDYSPARLKTGGVPPLPVLAVGGGEVLLEVTVGADGEVLEVTSLRTTASFTERLAGAVTGWEFVAAREAVANARPGEPPDRAVRSTVLVAGVFRHPATNSPTLGEAPQDVASPSPDAPFPLGMIVPPFPPMARNRGTVLLEAAVDARGVVTGVRVLIPAPPFDQAAADALREWRFRPGRRGGVGVPAFVYVVFGFPLPVTGGSG